MARPEAEQPSSKLLTALPDAPLAELFTLLRNSRRSSRSNWTAYIVSADASGVLSRTCSRTCRGGTQAIDAATVAKPGATACRKAGCPGMLKHDFRRTAVRNLETAGVPRSVAMKITGHKTKSVYRRYAIVSDADLQDAVRRLTGITTRITAHSDVAPAP